MPNQKIDLTLWLDFMLSTTALNGTCWAFSICSFAGVGVGIRKTVGVYFH